MAKMVEVTAARPHKSGHARRALKAGDKYSVPEGAVKALVRQKLVQDPAKAKAEENSAKPDSGKKNG